MQTKKLPVQQCVYLRWNSTEVSFWSLCCLSKIINTKHNCKADIFKYSNCCKASWGKMFPKLLVSKRIQEQIAKTQWFLLLHAYVILNPFMKSIRKIWMLKYGNKYKKQSLLLIHLLSILYLYHGLTNQLMHDLNHLLLKVSARCMGRHVEFIFTPFPVIPEPEFLNF